MNGFEFETYAKVAEQNFLQEAGRINICRKIRPGKGRIKGVVLNLSEFLIWLGTWLHNRYQPSIEETLIHYFNLQKRPS